MDGQGAGLVHRVQLVAEMRHQLGAEGDVDAGDGGQTAADLVRAVRVAGAEAIGVDHRIRRETLLTLELVQVTYRQLQDVRLLQLGDVLAVAGERGHHQVLQLVQTAIDARSAFALQHRFHYLRREGIVVVDVAFDFRRSVVSRREETRKSWLVNRNQVTEHLTE